MGSARAVPLPTFVLCPPPCFASHGHPRSFWALPKLHLALRRGWEGFSGPCGLVVSVVAVSLKELAVVLTSVLHFFLVRGRLSLYGDRSLRE